MIIFIDGPQSVGKSTLIEKSGFKNFKFEFSKLMKEFQLDESQIPGYQLGKDLASLYWLDKLNPDEVWLIDRGVMSSIYYSIIHNRLSSYQIFKLFDYLKQFKNLQYLFIKAENQPEIKRDKKDGFDNLDKEFNKDVLSTIYRECWSRNIPLHIFTNDFNESIEENVLDFKEKIDSIARYLK